MRGRGSAGLGWFGELDGCVSSAALVSGWVDVIRTFEGVYALLGQWAGRVLPKHGGRCVDVVIDLVQLLRTFIQTLISALDGMSCLLRRLLCSERHGNRSMRVPGTLRQGECLGSTSVSQLSFVAHLHLLVVVVRQGRRVVIIFDTDS